MVRLVPSVEAVISNSETADERAELAGVFNLEASRTFQNYKLSAEREVKGSSATHLGDHVTLGVPAFVLPVPVHLHELLENGILAPNAANRKLGRVVEMAIFDALEPAQCLTMRGHSQTLPFCS